MRVYYLADRPNAIGVCRRAGMDRTRYGNVDRQRDLLWLPANARHTLAELAAERVNRRRQSPIVSGCTNFPFCQSPITTPTARSFPNVLKSLRVQTTFLSRLTSINWGLSGPAWQLPKMRSPLGKSFSVVTQQR